MRKLTFIGFVLISAAIITAPAFAERNGWTDIANYDGKQAEHVEKLKLLLDLTPEQESEIRGIITDRRKDAGNHREAARKNREEVREILASETLNEQRLRELVHAQAELKIDRMIHKHESQTAIDQILTPEQKEKRQALQQMKRHRKGGHRWAGVKEM